MSSPTRVPPPADPFPVRREVAETGSTSADLVAAVIADDGAWPHLSALRTDHQVAGRGRAGRGWITPPGSALTFSVLVRPWRPRREWATLSLVAGLAVVRAVRALPTATDGPLDAALKWPNDVLLRGGGPAGDEADVEGWGGARKVAGILAEVVPGREAVVVGIGVNVGQRELPVPWATSLALAGVDIAPRELMDAVGHELVALLAVWEDGGFDAVRDEVAAATDTLGLQVAIDLGVAVEDDDGAQRLTGLAEALDADGRLVVVTPDGARHAVAAGDVVHTRRA